MATSLNSLFLALGLIMIAGPVLADTLHSADIGRARIVRPAIKLDLGRGFINAEPNREPIAEAPVTPGIYRSFLVWRQKYAHLAICRMDLCHGSCLEYGDGCLVCGQNPVLPTVMAISAPGGACASGCAPAYVSSSSSFGTVGCGNGGCH